MAGSCGVCLISGYSRIGSRFSACVSICLHSQLLGPLPSGLCKNGRAGCSKGTGREFCSRVKTDPNSVAAPAGASLEHNLATLRCSTIDATSVVRRSSVQSKHLLFRENRAKIAEAWKRVSERAQSRAFRPLMRPITSLQSDNLHYGRQCDLSPSSRGANLIHISAINRSKLLGRSFRNLTCSPYALY